MNYYHYTESGLSNVWLCNGFVEHKTPYGNGVSIEKLDTLHHAISLFLVNKDSRLNGEEFRFLRKELDLSQGRLGSLLGCEDQTIANWEKENTPLPQIADATIRMMYKEKHGGNQNFTKLIEFLNDLDRQEYTLRVKEEGDNWKVTQEAA